MIPDDEAIRLAYEAREKLSIAKNTRVGCCLVTYRGAMYQGANLENTYKKVPHAEEIAIFQGLMAGETGLDFEYLVQIANSDDRIFPACPSCVAFLWDYTHPDLMIYVVYEGEVVYEKSLREIQSGYGDIRHVYPSKINWSERKIGK